MKKIVVDMQNFLFGDSIAAAFKNSNYDIDVVRAETPQDTVELCRVYKPFVLVMEVTAYTPWLLCERMKLRDEVKTTCPDCKIALIVDSNTEKQAAKDIRDAKKNGLIDQFFYGSMTAEYLMDQIYAMLSATNKEAAEIQRRNEKKGGADHDTKETVRRFCSRQATGICDGLRSTRPVRRAAKGGNSPLRSVERKHGFMHRKKRIDKSSK